ncbi:MAG: channel, inward rectifier [Bacteroidetes bacterium]|jgi:inward rectifier potassium channel|nr:channel, inward rectifier [Bacteroidota bacterium]MDF2452569.1 channel, inward rectifier [Bacteroidota bacterium]
MIKDAFNNKKKLSAELGFGNKNYNESVRFLNQDGTVNITRKVSDKHIGFDIYHWLLSITWAQFITLVFISYIIVNTLFALVYFSIGAEKFGGMEVGTGSEKFSQLFFFSAQTLTTVGYGHIFPNSVFASSVSAIESMLGLMGFALVTGLLYGRFSKPKADIQYSRHAVIAPYFEQTGFMFRIANKKQNELIETECKLALAINNPDTKKRDFHFLELERNQINFLPFTWTVVHPIDEKSPLANLTEKDLHDRDAEFVILIKSITDTYFQTVYSRMSYKPHEIIWNAKFVPMKQTPQRKGGISINIKDIHDYTKV